MAKHIDGGWSKPGDGTFDDLFTIHTVPLSKPLKSSTPSDTAGAKPFPIKKAVDADPDTQEGDAPEPSSLRPVLTPEMMEQANQVMANLIRAHQDGGEEGLDQAIHDHLSAHETPEG
jgi:hypothetical protein